MLFESVGLRLRKIAIPARAIGIQVQLKVRLKRRSALAILRTVSAARRMAGSITPLSSYAPETGDGRPRYG